MLHWVLLFNQGDLMGISNMLAGIPGFVVPAFVGAVTENEVRVPMLCSHNTTVRMGWLKIPPI